MDPFEALLKKETNSDEKYVAAASFFTGLKTAAAKKKTKHNVSDAPIAKSTKARAKTRAAAKQIVEDAGGQSIKLPVRKSVPSPQTSLSKSLPELASRLTGKKIKSKKFSPLPDPAAVVKSLAVVKAKQPAKLKKLKYASAEERKHVLVSALMEKQARPISFLLDALTLGARGAKGGLRTAEQGIGSAVRGATAHVPPEPSLLHKGWNIAAGAVKKPWSALGNTTWGKGIVSRGKKIRQGVSDLADPQLAKARKGFEAAEMKKVLRGSITREQAAKNVKTSTDWFKRTRQAKDTMGFNTLGEINKAVRGKDGTISPTSVWEGLQRIGLTSPEQVMRGGQDAWAAMQAAKASKAAAKRHNQMMMLGGGAAGVGALALLKGSRKNQPQPMPVRMVQ